MCFVLEPCFGQKNSKKQKEKDELNFKDKIWYGGSFLLGFNSTRLNNGAPGNLFSIGIAPMVGYKINSFWSVGPRVEFIYASGRFDFSPTVIKYRAYNYGAGIFTRLKFLRYFFGHLEYNYYYETFLTGGISIDNKLETVRLGNDHLNIGLGYNPGGTFSYDLSILYDFLADKNSINLPFQYRIGFTYLF
ncbi:MAG: hypothetical protein M3Q56_05585 [Bacteroidota bacterium]|nr:hypothetical protein [Bacteroidota bacterium]